MIPYKPLSRKARRVALKLCGLMPEEALKIAVIIISSIEKNSSNHFPLEMVERNGSKIRITIEDVV